MTERKFVPGNRYVFVAKKYEIDARKCWAQAKKTLWARVCNGQEVYASESLTNVDGTWARTLNGYRVHRDWCKCIYNATEAERKLAKLKQDIEI